MQKVKAILAVAVVGFVVALVVFNASQPSAPISDAWNEAMTKGNKETGAHFVMYTDIFCPYCDKFSNALIANSEDFEAEYIDSGKVYYEMRLTNINYVNFQGYEENTTNSLYGGESVYCAAKQDGKFWPYYEAILGKLYDDYHSKGIGVSKTSEHIPELPVSYFYGAAETAELNMDEFKGCMENHEALEELEKNTAKAQKIIPSGVPYFVFGDYKASGFDGNWNTDNDYKNAKLMLEAGL